MNKLAIFLAKGDKTWHDISQTNQESYVNSLRAPKNTIDRGYLQYKCQMYFSSPIKKVVLNIAAACAFPFVLLSLMVKKKHFIKKVDAVGEFGGLEEVIPSVLTDRYVIDNQAWDESGSLSISDLGFCLRLALRYPLSPLFVSKCVFKVAKYFSFITCYNPAAIIVHNEYSYTSSVLTAYCRTYNVRHINAMHGEKLYFIRDSFFEYDECYVWNEHYKKLLVDMRADEKQFIIALPPSIQIDTNLYRNENDFANYKYYLAAYNDTQIRSIVASMQFAKKNGKSVKYRPHPRYSNIELLKKYVRDDEIEMPREVTILSSISNLEFAVGSYSTVLLQAYYSGRGVVCDDITYAQNYKQLKGYRWMLADADTIRLSELQ